MHIESIAGVTSLQQISQTGLSLVFTANDSQNRPVIVKVPKGKDQETFASFEHELLILDHLAQRGYISFFRRFEFEGKPSIIMPNLGRRSLRNFMQLDKNTSLEKIIKIAISLAAALEDLQRHHVIHCDISPENFVCTDEESNRWTLIDFNLSSLWSNQSFDFSPTGQIKGTLRYISPEQTGRINRNVSYLCDHYSLGLVLYELITGECAFSGDPLELVYCHIAKNPLPMHTLRADVPEVLCAIVDKLISKKPEQRYQNLAALRHDLQNLLEQIPLNPKSPAAEFDVGATDIAQSLRIPDKLYGRETQIERLVQVFEQACHSLKTQFGLVFGPSGIGKTSLVKELYGPITARKGLFAEGKCELFKQEIPYYCVSQALERYISHFAVEFPERAAELQSEFILLAGVDLDLLLGALPGLELIVGKAPVSGNKPPQGEAKERLAQLFRQVIEALMASRPGVLFLDDLQWVDTASLQLIENLVTEDAGGFFIIGSFRNNEVDANHPLTLMIERVKSKQVEISEFNVGALRRRDLTALLQDCFTPFTGDLTAIAEFVTSRTKGNPFFVQQMIIELYRKEVFRFSFEQQKWLINTHLLTNVPMAENVIDLLLSSLKTMHAHNRILLGTASLIGASFDLDVVSQSIPRKTENHREIARRLCGSGYISALDSEVHLSDRSASDSQLRFKFAHDKIQEACAELLNPTERALCHRKIAHALYLRTDANPELHFEIIKHLGELAELDEEAQATLRTSLHAGANLAMRAGAFQVATKLFDMLVNSIGPQHQDYILLRLKGYESRLLSGDYSFADELLGFARSTKDQDLRQRGYIVSLDLLSLAKEYERCIAVAIERLRELNFKVRNSASGPLMLYSLIRLGRQLKKFGTQTEALFDPNYKDMILEVTLKMGSSAFFYSPEYMVYLNAKVIEYSLKIGKINDAAMIMLGATGFIASGMLLDFKLARLIGLLCEKYTKICEVPETNVCLVHFVHMMIDSIYRPLPESTKCAESFDINGNRNTEYVGYVLSRSNGRIYFENLQTYFRHNEEMRKTMVRMRCNRSLDSETLLAAARRRYVNLEEFDAPIIEAPAREGIIGAAIVTQVQLELFIIMDRFDKAEPLLKRALKLFTGIPGGYGTHCLFFWAAILKARHLKHFRKPILWFLFRYVKACAENFAHLFYLAEAELYSKTKNALQTARSYEKAYQSAKANGFIGFSGLIAERAALFWKSQGNQTIFKKYLESSYRHYQRWGAETKLKIMESEYPDLSRAQLEKTRNISDTTSISTRSEDLDLLSLIKSTRAISSLLDFESLADKLLDLAMENAGASRGYLYTNLDGKLTRAASRDVATGSEGLHPLQGPADWLRPIVFDAIRLNEERVVDDVRKAGFAGATGEGSLLILPLTGSGNLELALVLEHSASGIFTANHLTVVRVLAAQAAVSFQNARLLEEVRDKSRMEAELAAARVVQDTLLAKYATVDSLDIAHYYQSADQTGGDWFGYYVDKTTNVCFLCCGDVTGHGIPSALITGVATGALEAVFWRFFELSRKGQVYDPAAAVTEALDCANAAICHTGERQNRSMSLVVIALELDSGLGYIGNAGHVLPIHLTSNPVKKAVDYDATASPNAPGRRSQRVGKPGELLGFQERIETWEISQVQLNPGDCLITFTDGLIENTGPGGEILRERAMRHSIEELQDCSAEAVLGTILNEGRKQWGTQAPDDDCTVAVYRWLGPSQESLALGA